MDQPFSAFIYISRGLWRSFLSFFSDWYIFIPRLYWKKVLWFLKDLDRSLAIKAMAKHWLTPLYQDYNIAGYFIGIFIRTFWIILGGLFYIIFFLIAVFIFLVWLLVLPCLVFMILFNLTS